MSPEGRRERSVPGRAIGPGAAEKACHADGRGELADTSPKSISDPHRTTTR